MRETNDSTRKTLVTRKPFRFMRETLDLRVKQYLKI